MKKLRAWFTVGSFAFLGFGTAVSCGSDEATGKNNGNGGGGIVPGGGGGRSGSGGQTTTGGNGGSTTTATNLGNDCITDAECGNGMICIARDDVDTLGGAPPKGLCTVACGNEQEGYSDDPCLELSSDAWCVPYESEGNVGYCLEGCLLDAGFGSKCHDRPEFVCSVVDAQPLEPEQGCELSSECPTNTVCIEGACNAVLSLCLPNCGSDADCDDGLFCDYISGLCVEAAPTGKDFNEICDPANDAECAGGYCLETYADETEGTCSGLCNLGAPYSCGFTGEGPAETGCLFATIFAGEQAEAGDLGFCSQLCDCDDECTATGEVCRAWGVDEADFYEMLYGRTGYCVPIVDGGTFTADDAIGPCAGGAPGAGGAGGAPGAGGAGGAPSSEAGAGGEPSTPPGGGAGGAAGAG